MAKMFRINDWNENEKFSLKKVAQDVVDTSGLNTSCCVDTTNLKVVETSCSSNIKTSCCIDTTKIIAGPCNNDIQTSCCIDTTRE